MFTQTHSHHNTKNPWLQLKRLRPPSSVHHSIFPTFHSDLRNSLEFTALKINTAGCVCVCLCGPCRSGVNWTQERKAAPLLQFILPGFVKPVKPPPQNPLLKLDANEISSGIPRRTLWNWLAWGNLRGCLQVCVCGFVCVECAAEATSVFLSLTFPNALFTIVKKIELVRRRYHYDRWIFYFLTSCELDWELYTMCNKEIK